MLLILDALRKRDGKEDFIAAAAAADDQAVGACAGPVLNEIDDLGEDGRGKKTNEGVGYLDFG